MTSAVALGILSNVLASLALWLLSDLKGDIRELRARFDKHIERGNE